MMAVVVLAGLVDTEHLALSSSLLSTYSGLLLVCTSSNTYYAYSCKLSTSLDSLYLP
jgi:hypothetical protein